MDTELKKFWNSCGRTFAHLEIVGHLKNYDTLSKGWEKEFISKLDFNNKIVLDYGIGGAYLGKYLFENKDINYYYGIDLSDRSLQKAEENLKRYKEHTLLITDEFYDNFNKKVDIIICQACIQHFPNEEYLIKFINKINNLNAEYIMLQIAYKKETKFKNETYNSVQSVVRACYTNKDFILKYLNNYDTYFEGDIGTAATDYQFLIFHKMN